MGRHEGPTARLRHRWGPRLPDRPGASDVPCSSAHGLRRAEILPRFRNLDAACGQLDHEEDAEGDETTQRRRSSSGARTASQPFTSRDPADRGAFLADHFGAARLVFPGWDLDDLSVGSEKAHKLAWAERLLAWLERRRGERFTVLDGRREAIEPVGR